MTLYTFPAPPTLVKAALEAGKPSLWPTATISTSFPAESITVPHIQHAWDGTPDAARNFESATVRVTTWGPKVGGVQRSTADNLASLVQAYLLENGIGGAWRVTRGAGRLPDIDPDTGLPFCTFTLNVDTRPVAVA